MSPKRFLHRVFAVVFLLASTLVARPAEARSQAREVTVFGENGLARVWTLLWQLRSAKEGTSIDPDGGKNDEGVTIDPDGAPEEEGMSIDPNGQP